MIAYRYVYLLSSSLFLIYWLILWFKLKGNEPARRQLLFFSCLFAILGPISALVWFGDWWQPTTIWGTKAGIEDFILGFTNGGLATTAYYFFFKPSETSAKPRPKTIIVLLLLYIGLATLGMLVFALNSFESNILGLFCVVLLAHWKRRDLRSLSIISGLSLVLMALPIYLLIGWLSPGWIETTWHFTSLSGLTWFKVPIEDYLWYMMVGSALSVIAPLASGQHFQWRFKKF